MRDRGPTTTHSLLDSYRRQQLKRRDAFAIEKAQTRLASRRLSNADEVARLPGRGARLWSLQMCGQEFARRS